MDVSGTPFIVLTVAGLMSAGYENILVACDRPEWLSVLAEVLADWPGVLVAEDAGYASTMQLARSFAPFMPGRFVFTYGHAPRSVKQYSALRSETPPAALSFARTSKSKPIPWHDRFLEPPYLLRRSDLTESWANEWTEFFANFSHTARIVETNDPPEFNYPAELESYVAYARGLCVSTASQSQKAPTVSHS
jgi:hypothetical protein